MVDWKWPRDHLVEGLTKMLMDHWVVLHCFVARVAEVFVIPETLMPLKGLAFPLFATVEDPEVLLMGKVEGPEVQLVDK